MNIFITIILLLAGFLFILVYPKIIRYAIFVVITYLTILVDLYWAIAYIPYLILMFYFKRRERQHG